MIEVQGPRGSWSPTMPALILGNASIPNPRRSSTGPRYVAGLESYDPMEGHAAEEMLQWNERTLTPTRRPPPWPCWLASMHDMYGFLLKYAVRRSRRRKGCASLSLWTPTFLSTLFLSSVESPSTPTGRQDGWLSDARQLQVLQA